MCKITQQGKYIRNIVNRLRTNTVKVLFCQVVPIFALFEGFQALLLVLIPHREQCLLPVKRPVSAV